MYQRRKLILSVAGLSLIPSFFISRLAWASNVLPRTNWAYDGTRKGLHSSLAEFFGNSKGRYINMRHVPMRHIANGDRTSLLSQFNNIFHDAPGEELQIDGGYRVLNSYRTHDATQRCYVVTLGDSNSIVATALLHNRSGIYNNLGEGVRDPKRAWDPKRVLTIMYSGTTAPNQTVTPALIKLVEDHLITTTRKGKITQFYPEVRRIRPA